MNYDIDSQLADYISRARRWQSGHSEASMHYQRVEHFLGIPSVFIGTIVLGFAFYAVERTNAPVWSQYALAGLSIVQGVLISIQAYLRPAALSEQYRGTAARYIKIAHAYEKLRLERLCGKEVLLENIEEIMAESDEVAKEARLLPRSIMRKIKNSSSP